MATSLRYRERNSPSTSSEGSIPFGVGYLPQSYGENVLDEEDSDCSGKYDEFPKLYNGSFSSLQYLRFLRGTYAGYETTRFSTTSESEVDSEAFSPSRSSPRLSNAASVTTTSDEINESDVQYESDSNCLIPRIEELQQVRNSTTGLITYQFVPIYTTRIYDEVFEYEADSEPESEPAENSDFGECQNTPKWIGQKDDAEDELSELSEVFFEKKWDCPSCYNKNHSMSNRCAQCFLLTGNSLKRSVSSPPLIDTDKKRQFTMPSSTITSRDMNLSRTSNVTKENNINDSGFESMSSQELTVEGNTTQSDVLDTALSDVQSTCSCPVDSKLQENVKPVISEARIDTNVLSRRTNSSTPFLIPHSLQKTPTINNTSSPDNFQCTSKTDLLPKKTADDEQDSFECDNLIFLKPESDPFFQQKCCVCLEGVRNATFIHGDTGHQCCCYDCAKTLKEMKKKCPICRKRIDHVIVNYF
ncbi:E3 ubiquitin-protein ligase Mdm2-like isoform X1 [Hydractinia symbiolongicarpus]|uniref:E3 ubiquitin-protein ligase Mdm2-like isoform X1 n=1 Tax=Hydractinia symbiolongicarpus TaxID=13093 RepID=UPI00254B4B6E|nr:E3 ubiquitin-protein ligase Mdm2-like isoform X1 [Hydractinia symbiolongicarpus]